MSTVNSEVGVPAKILDKPPSHAALNPFNIPSQDVLHQLPGCTVVRTGVTVHKYGSGVSVTESLALEFAYNIGVPAPRIHNVRHSDSNGVTQCAIEMDYVKGKTLFEAWPQLTKPEKLSVAQQLDKILAVMRSVTPPSDMIIGSIGGHVARDIREIDVHTGGPFRNETEFNEFQLDIYSSTPNVLVQEIRTRLRGDHRIVFSHGDLNQRNIVVKDSTVVAILDWEVAGWYPEHWDFVKFFFQPTSHGDWHDCVRTIFPETYFDELFLQYTLRRWQRG